MEKAKEIALTQANVKAADAVFDDKEFDHDDGTPIFELEFTADGNEYEYDIHAVTGKVLRAEHEKIKNSQNSSKPSENTSSGSANSKDTDYGPNNDGVTDYNDTDYGPNNDGVTDYNDNTDDGDTNYGGDTNYDDGGSDYSDDDDDDDDDDD